MKILIIEDDADIREFVAEGFKAEGFVVDAAHNGEQGSYMARTNPYDVVILDYSLPLRNGLEVCEEIRAAGSHVPIIFLSVISDTNKKIEALQKGADDYLSKPFFFDELKERVKALHRRPRLIENPVITVGELSLDVHKRTVIRDGEPIYLTRKEFSLLEFLMRNHDRAVTRSMILDHVWSAESDPMSNTVETHMLRLRKKIGDIGSEYIRNIPGRGYILSS